MTGLNRSRIIKIAGTVVVLGAMTFGLRGWWLSAHAAEPAAVNTAAVTYGPVVNEVNATGTLQAVTTVQVGSQISGTIAWLGADFNSVVRKGEVIARLDSRPMESQVTQARAGLVRATAEAENSREQLRAARQKQEQMQSLWDKHLIPQNDFDASVVAVSLAEQQVKSAAAQISQADASLKQAEVALSYAVITSPIDGIVIQRSVDVGQTVSASMSAPTLFAIANNLTDMQVKAGIDESDISRVQPKQRVTFGVDAYPNQTFEGTVLQVRLEPTLVQNVTTYSVIIDAPNPELKLLPGMTANVGIQSAARDNVMRVPNAALRFRPTPAMFAALGLKPSTAVPNDDGESGIDYNGAVWVYANGALTSVPVQAGISNGQLTELVAADLPSDARVVTGINVGGTRTTTAAAPTNNIFMMPGAGGGGRGFRG